MTKFCPNPYEWLDISAWGHDSVKFSTCIESWGGEGARLAVLPFTEAAELTIDDIWNGQKAQQIRYQASTNGRPAFCDGCPRWKANIEPVEIDGRTCGDCAAMPKTLNLAYDRSCNLQCPSCRTHTIFHSPGSIEHAVLSKFQDKIVRPLLKTADRAFLAGLGDPFGSPCYSELLRTVQPDDAPTLKWYILTNGQGFTQKRYEEIPTRRQIDAVQFSIDAACPETYAQNRSSNWRRLIDNLAFAGSLRRSGYLDKLDISMVVQWNNYKEAVAFVELAKAHSVDTVLFSALLPQGTYRDADYLHRAVHLSMHAEHGNAMQCLTNATIVGADNGINVTVEMPRC